MKIAFLQRDLPPQKRGGVAGQVHLLANTLTGMGQEVALFTLSPQPPDARYEVRTLVPPDWAKHSRLARRYLLGLFFSRADLSGFDVIHAHGDNWLLHGRRPQVRTYYGSALAEALHSDRPASCADQALLWLLELLGIAAADQRIAISPGTRRYLPGIHRIIPCGIDPTRFRPGGTRHDKPAVLFVGTLSGRKRGRLLLPLFRALRQRIPEAELWIVGPEHVKGEGIVCCRDLPEEALIDLYQRAWILCHPAAYEGFGLPLLEAMACGTPVIAAPNDGSGFVLEQGRHGILAPPAAMLEPLLRLLANPAERESWASRGLARARTFDIRKTAEAYLEVYHALAR